MDAEIKADLRQGGDGLVRIPWPPDVALLPAGCHGRTEVNRTGKQYGSDLASIHIEEVTYATRTAARTQARKLSDGVELALEGAIESLGNFATDGMGRIILRRLPKFGLTNAVGDVQGSALELAEAIAKARAAQKRKFFFDKLSDDVQSLVDEATYSHRPGTILAIPGGVAGAIRHTKSTGQLVGGSDHLQKRT